MKSLLHFCRDTHWFQPFLGNSCNIFYELKTDKIRVGSNWQSCNKVFSTHRKRKKTKTFENVSHFCRDTHWLQPFLGNSCNSFDEHETLIRLENDQIDPLVTISLQNPKKGKNLEKFITFLLGHTLITTFFRQLLEYLLSLYNIVLRQGAKSELFSENWSMKN